jgi:hypothetical protein
MARKRNPPDAIGDTLAKVMDVKRRLIEAGIQRGDLGPARELFEGVRDFLRCLREDLAEQLCDGSLEDMTPEQAQQAIYNVQILEGSLQADFPELSH